MFCIGSQHFCTNRQAAIDAGCERLYSEDLQHGRAFGWLTIFESIFGLICWLSFCAKCGETAPQIL
jgi:hypothetical protein